MVKGQVEPLAAVNISETPSATCDESPNYNVTTPQSFAADANVNVAGATPATAITSNCGFMSPSDPPSPSFSPCAHTPKSRVLPRSTTSSKGEKGDKRTFWDFLAGFSLENDASEESPNEVSHCCRLVLTGGPCGGKTTALSTIADYLRSLGTQVFVVPENATIFMNGGAPFPIHAPKAQQMCWETSRILCQIQMENSFIRYAQASGKPTVIICDRGTMDAAAYMDTQRWAELLEQMNWQTDQLREDRYDAVIHLVSAAIGAEEYYTLNTNEVRKENIAQAAALDLKIREVWKGHPHVEIIDNSTDFSRKVVRVLEAICRILGIRAPTSNGVFYIYNIDSVIKEKLPHMCLRFEEFFVQTVFLKNSTEEENQSVRCRRQRDHSSELSIYTWASRTRLQNGQFAIEERAITAKEYFALLKQADPQLSPVRRCRRCFVFADQYFQLDEYDDAMLLSVEVHSENAEVVLPPWIVPYVLGNVTQDPRYTVFGAAKRLYDLFQTRKQNVGLMVGTVSKSLLRSALLASSQQQQQQPRTTTTTTLVAVNSFSSPKPSPLASSLEPIPRCSTNLSSSLNFKSGTLAGDGALFAAQQETMSFGSVGSHGPVVYGYGGVGALALEGVDSGMRGSHWCDSDDLCSIRSQPRTDHLCSDDHMSVLSHDLK